MLEKTVALVIDDHPITLLGCQRLLEEAGYRTVVNAQESKEALRLAERHCPRIVVLDLIMPGVGGLQMIQPLKRRAPECRILVFSINDSPVFVMRALEAGAHGYLPKTTPPKFFLEAIHSLERDQIYLGRDMAINVAMLSAQRKVAPLSDLTMREHQVLQLIGQGKRYGEIASQINVSYKTVANTCAILKKKLYVRSLSGLIRIAVLSEEDLRKEADLQKPSER